MSRLLPVPTRATWAVWLADAERRLCDVYRLSPQHLVAEYRREREITHGYHGREILELLQNAGDAARREDMPGRVRIVVNQHGMVIGNTGRPFDEGGMGSLQTANLSPKREREAVVIGDKGLGFRSILNWTHSPLISSGDLSIAFLPAYAASVLQRLEEGNEHVARLVAKEREIAGRLIVPRLAFPEQIADWAAHPWPDNGAILAVAKSCHGLRREGFDTVIGMPFAKAGARDEVVAQLEELQPEFLLLVDSVARLEIQIDGGESRVWTRKPEGGRQVIRDGERELSAWTVKSFDDELPPQLIETEEHTKTRFRLTVAIPEHGLSVPGRFYCYFPTDAELPLPLLAHATVELDETRKHVNDTRANRHILEALAARIAEVAELWLERSSEDRWAGCRLVTPTGAWSGELARFGFVAALKEAARNKKLIPVLDGGHRLASEAKWVPGDETRWWSNRIFPEITAFECAEERNLAKYLEVERLASVEIVRRLLAAGDLSLEERAKAIAGLLRSGDQEIGGDLSALLCDETAAPLPPGGSAIFQPTGETPEIPVWATLRFLHPELRRHLGELLATSDVRELQQRLKRFGVVEYSLAALVRPVLAEANRRARDFPETEPELRADVLRFLFGLYQKLGAESLFPPEATLGLPSQSGDWIAPHHLYLGEGYGREGKVTQDLYSAWAPEKLLARPKHLGLGETTDRLIAFLLWLGVARWPRIVGQDQISSDFLDEVKNGLHYPVEFGDCKFESPNALAGAWAADFHTVDGLVEILKHAAPEAILAWLSLDSRSVQWERAMPEHGTLKIFPAHKQYARSYTGPVPSLMHWKIATTAWLPAADGAKKAPRHCLIGDRQLESLFPQPAQPDSRLKDRYGITERIVECYSRAGVMPGLAQIGRDELYRLLLEAPNLSRDGKASRALCRWFLLHENALFGYEGEHQKRFFREGRLWGTKADQTGFFGVRELRHVDFEGLPPALLRSLAIADLPKRVGAQKVREILGVTPLERSAIRQELIAHRTSPRHEDRSRWFTEAKPSLKGLRQAQTRQAQSVGVIGRLDLVLCDELRVQLRCEGASDEHVAKEGEWFIFGDLLYVRGDLDDSIDLLADAAGLAVASVFGIADGDAFSKVLRCEPKNRGKLLKRMCGDEFQGEIEASSPALRPTYTGPVEAPTATNTAAVDTAGESEYCPEGPVREELASDQNDHDQPPKGVTPLPHEPLPAKAERKLVLRKVQRKAGAHSGLRQTVDGDLCERMAVAFEEQYHPPRFALGVGHITGAEAPGFDLVSLETAEEREAFKNPATRDWTRVQRFIEVKGRSSSTAKIELKGNELRAARNYGDRYYLYRFYQHADGHYFVSILKNPMGAEDALNPGVEIDLERARATQRYEFVAESAETENSEAQV